MEIDGSVEFLRGGGGEEEKGIRLVTLKGGAFCISVHIIEA